MPQSAAHSLKGASSVSLVRSVSAGAFTWMIETRLDCQSSRARPVVRRRPRVDAAVTDRNDDALAPGMNEVVDGSSGPEPSGTVITSDVNHRPHTHNPDEVVVSRRVSSRRRRPGLSVLPALPKRLRASRSSFVSLRSVHVADPNVLP